jgi:chromosome segregation ATPase
MKKVKAEAEKVQKNLENVNKANKRVQADNASLQSKLSALGNAAQQLEEGGIEITSLRTELDEATVALKAARHSEKHALKEMHDLHLEIKTERRKTEEQAESIKTLLVERDRQNAELVSVGEHLKEWTTTAHLTSDSLREAQEKIFDLNEEVAELKKEHKKLVEIVNTTDDGGMRKELLEMEEECHDLREENKRLKKDHERTKRQLDKAQEQRLILDHDLAVARHEQKEREAELQSIQDYLHNKGKNPRLFSFFCLSFLFYPLFLRAPQFPKMPPASKTS